MHTQLYPDAYLGDRLAFSPMVQPLHIVGLCIALLSCVQSNVGILIQKYSTEVESHKPLYRRWRFWLGFTVNMSSEIVLSSVALNFAPLAMIAPSGGFGIISNAFLARYGPRWCGEKEFLTAADWAATLLLFAGVTLVAVSGPGSQATEQPSLTELPTQFAQPAFLAFAGIATVGVVCWVLLTHLACLKKYRPEPRSLTTTVCACTSASFIGAFSVVWLKIVAIAIPAWVSAGTPPPPISWPAIPFLSTIGPLQLYLLNMALASGQAMFAVPLYLSLICVFLSFMAGLLFNEFSSLIRPPLPLYLVLYILGLCLVLGALACLARSQALKERNRLSKLAPAPAPIKGADSLPSTPTSTTSASSKSGASVVNSPEIERRVASV